MCYMSCLRTTQHITTQHKILTHYNATSWRQLNVESTFLFSFLCFWLKQGEGGRGWGEVRGWSVMGWGGLGGCTFDFDAPKIGFFFFFTNIDKNQYYKFFIKLPIEANRF